MTRCAYLVKRHQYCVSTAGSSDQEALTINFSHPANMGPAPAEEEKERSLAQ